MSGPLNVLGRRRIVVGAVLALGLVLGLTVAATRVGRDDRVSRSPLVGVWQELPPPPGLAARFHVLGWTGSEVLVVGGSDDVYSHFGGDARPVFQTAGAAYDPVTGTWRMLPDAPVPVGTGATAATMSGDRLVVVGDDGEWWQYDASDDAWSSLDQAPHPGPEPFLAELDGRVYAMPGRYEEQAWVDVLDVASGSWSTLPRRPHAHGILPSQLVATTDGLVVVGTRAPGSSAHDPVAADVLDETGWSRTVGPQLTVGGNWSWTGARLVMPLPDLDQVGDNQSGLALDVASRTWTSLPEGPYYQSGGWGVVAVDGPRVFLDGYLYDDRDATWTTVRRPAYDMGELEAAERVPGLVAGDRIVVVGEGTAWISAQ